MKVVPTMMADLEEIGNIANMTHKFINLCQAKYFCSICLESAEKMWLLDTEFDITVNGTTQKKQLKDLIYYVFRDWNQVAASIYICSSCSEKSIQSYLFIYNARQLSKVISNYVHDLLTKVNDVNHQLGTDDESKNTNVVIVLDENAEIINNYVDICKATEIMAEESTHDDVQVNEKNKDEGLTVKINTPENKLKPLRTCLQKITKMAVYRFIFREIH